MKSWRASEEYNVGKWLCLKWLLWILNEKIATNWNRLEKYQKTIIIFNTAIISSVMRAEGERKHIFVVLFRRVLWSKHKHKHLFKLKLRTLFYFAILCYALYTWVFCIRLVDFRGFSNLQTILITRLCKMSVDFNQNVCSANKIVSENVENAVCGTMFEYVFGLIGLLSAWREID